jgi:hypothetical protein
MQKDFCNAKTTVVDFWSMHSLQFLVQCMQLELHVAAWLRWTHDLLPGCCCRGGGGGCDKGSDDSDSGPLGAACPLYHGVGWVVTRLG